MLQYPAVVVHGLADARLALGMRAPVTLLSAPGAALYAGCGWWRALIAHARAEFADAIMTDALDCADASGLALAALRIRQHVVVLAPDAPGWTAVAAIASEWGGLVLAARPPALDLAGRGALRRLPGWLSAIG
ncbi:MAG TPA: hypothetical protein VIZ17_20355 [Acetobacteraceae bacterium]